MTIAGRSVPGTAFFDVENPATGEIYGQAPECTPAELDKAMNAAEAAFGSWREDDKSRRAGLLGAADAIEGSLEELASLITHEQGKPLAESRSELADAMSDLRYYAHLELPREIIRDDERALVEVVRKPVGPVAAITPWNFPLGTAVVKLAPALAAGCTVVLKPSPLTPLACLRFGELVRELFPAGVLNIVSGGNDLGAAMSEHPVPRQISFTGSVATGKKISLAAAPDLKRVTLELGGNDPAILLDDVDPEETAESIFANAFVNCGQVCVAIKRVYVPERLYGEVVDALVVRAKAASIGDGSLEGVDLGPLTSTTQLDRVAGLVEDAVAQGAKLATGGRRIDGPGHFYEPTILTGLDDGVRIVDEEQFGPALPVMSYRDIDEVIERANRTHFGLGASVWTRDAARGNSVARRMDAGTAWVNTHQSAVPGQPFGGVKWSGIGLEGGPWGLIAFTDVQALYTANR
ncbi:MAG: aldehyde dehydrogenase family protein [Acidimicrobiales bacterium]|jgi:acyl-CoA reductase-like NAD-dependent aldehyde dehydrogenase